MKKISSGQIFFLKRIFPVLFVAVAVLPLGFIFLGGSPRIPVQAIVAPLLAVAILFVVMKKLVWDLADEVRDGGDYLVVRKGRIEERVPLSNVMNVSATTMVNPPRIELTLAEPGRLGARIAFAPARNATLNPFARNAIAEDLIVRVDRARANRKR